MGLKETLTLNLKNIPGGRTGRKLLVIECDDWGGIRMPSGDTYTRLQKDNVPFVKNRFNRYDTLADSEDLERLFEVLRNVTDSKGRGAVMTAFTNVANPDFKKIRGSDFCEYSYEPFTETLKRYYGDSGAFDKWLEGLRQGIFVPESHGREHISAQFWMRKLREGNFLARKAYDNEFAAISIDGLIPALDQFRPEFFFDSQDQIPFLKNSIKTGANLFEKLFGYKSRVFAPSNSVFHPGFEPDLLISGVQYLYVNTFNPVPDGKGSLKYHFYRNGKKSPSGLIYYTRNCAFEPTAPGYRGIDTTMKQIETAFRWNKPANISTHRVNFIGRISKDNRDKGLRELQSLLSAVIKKWPDVEFLSSAQMFDEIHQKPLDK